MQICADSEKGQKESCSLGETLGKVDFHNLQICIASDFQMCSDITGQAGWRGRRRRRFSSVRCKFKHFGRKEEGGERPLDGVGNFPAKLER